MHMGPHKEQLMQQPLICHVHTGLYSWEYRLVKEKQMLEILVRLEFAGYWRRISNLCVNPS